jgi:sugar phosphate isomerase/epimerase
MPQLPRDTEADRALLDKAFGVGELGGPQQSPSYTLGLARINEFYQKHQFEYALVEINNLLTYYPTSIKLHKMKGTVLIKLSSLALAERAWLRAAELAPDDPVVKKGLERLRRKMDLERKVSGQLVNPPPAAPPSAQELPQQPTPQSLQRDNRDLDQRQ